MGRRKERRLASLSGAGRRVKLDLFAEPSGDAAGSSAQEEIGGNNDSKVVDELPSPPSSSGQQPQNPLLLLGQYSDEELDEGSSDRNNHALAEDASDVNDHEETNTADKETEDIKNNAGNAGNESAMQHMEQLPIDRAFVSQDPLQKLDNGGISTNDSEDLLNETNYVEEDSCPTASNKQPVEDSSSCWKMVLHEESNQYYYWNIATGETSWEVPPVVALGSVTSSVDKVGGDIEVNTHLDVEKDDTSRKLNGDSKLNYEISGAAEQGTSMGGPNERSKGYSLDDGDENIDVGLSHVTNFPSDLHVVNGTKLDIEHSIENKTGSDLPPRLVKHCEILLARLNSLKSLSCHLEGQDIKVKCILEIEVRLADIKALAPHGSSLLTFWLHSEAQLKQIESTVDDVIRRYGSDADIKIDSSEKKALLDAAESDSPEHAAEKSNYGAQCDDDTNTKHVPLGQYHTTPSVYVGGTSDVTGTEMESSLTPKPHLHSVEEADMDVDMEVEDTSTSISDAHHPVSSESSNPQNVLTNQESVAAGQVCIISPPIEGWVPPQPPDDEPLPPLPPDDEPYPPPPPDEPPEPSYPPISQSEAAQPFAYSEQYTLSYPGSSFEYYGQMPTEIPGTSLYTHLPHYYENAYAVSPVVVSPVGASDYYGLQSGTLNLVPLTSESNVNPPGTLSGSVPENRESDVAAPKQVHAEAGSNLILNTNLDIASSHGIVKAPPEVPDVRPSVAAAAISSVNKSVSVSSSSNTTIASIANTTETTSKIQPKAARGKKRTAAVVSTLRPNKKVSSLVDKWKAVKEELHEEEEEEEPENAYEILEKKRKKEIEEWRAQQIASGEAKDNANFQPLGGDWRERVKRRMAQKKKEARKSSPDGNQQPDLVEIARGLPSGWQVYWDDSSKQVYYGNTSTSQTTWSLPTD